jgi:MFS superfamily sulfate permease-like transporter
MNLSNTTSSNASWRSDIKSGLVVFLIALPLSLGISIASGAPPSAGLISAVMGGLIGAYLGGGHVTINGPAAGLIVVVLTAIQNLGQGDPIIGFRRMLACVVIVGILQIISGVLKAGRLAALFPMSVVHGMLASIGLIIMIKQSHVFFGHSAKGSIISSLVNIPYSAMNQVIESTIIGLVSLAILLIYPRLKFSLTNVIPAPLIVALGGIGLGMYLHPLGMVNIPTNISDFLIFPLFDVIFSTYSILAIITIFFVASLESILSASAVDQLDPLGRETNFNKELWSKGLVNLFCGLIGGLPIIAEIVRSSANISQGARTPLSNFSHSLFILIFILAFPSVLNMIPLSALAAILILVGFRLAHPKQFMEMWHLGINSFIAFAVTIVVTLTEDLFLGVLAGLIVKCVLFLLSGSKLSNLFKPKYEILDEGNKALINFEGAITFLSALKQKEIFLEVSKYKEIKIDLTSVTFIDPTSLSIINQESAKITKNGGVIIISLPEKYQALMIHLKGH